MVRRLRRHMFFTFLIALIMVFLTGILLGRHLERSAESEIADFLKETELNTESYLLEQALIRAAGGEACDLAARRISSLSEELGEIGRRLSTEDIDKILGEDNFNLLKRRYHLTQVRTYLLYQQLQDTCDVDQAIVLFYYGEDNGESQKQGKILDELVTEQGITVFAVEYNYSAELNFIEVFYNVTETPTIVINYTTPYPGLQEKDALIRLLD